MLPRMENEGGHLRETRERMIEGGTGGKVSDILVFIISTTLSKHTGSKEPPNVQTFTELLKITPSYSPGV